MFTEMAILKDEELNRHESDNIVEHISVEIELRVYGLL